jgi:hypothetical protein
MKDSSKRQPKNIEDVLNKLTNVKPSGKDKWSADCPCPGHETPSGHLSIFDTGVKALVKCFNTHEFADICLALGFDSFSYGNQGANTGRRIIRVFNYQDVDGNLIYQILRYEPKSFGVRRPDGTGNWMYNLGPIQPVLYHLPDILTARIYGDTVYVCEGERDADNAFLYYGTPATTCPFGAGKWTPEYAKWLYGCNVTIIPDNDEPGRRHALAIVASLQQKVKSLTIQRVPPEFKDLTEWLQCQNLLDVI